MINSFKGKLWANGFVKKSIKSTQKNPSFKRTYATLTTQGGRSSNSGVVVTVFGCTGFLGRYTVNAFGSIGSQVVIPYRGEESSYNHLKVMGDLGQIVPMQWDIRDPDSIYEAVRHSDVVVNLTGSKWPTRNFTLEDVNIEGAKRIAEVSKAAGVPRFIHVSASGFDKNTDCNFLRTKFLGEEAVRAAFPAATILRPTIYFGMEDLYTVRTAYQMRYWPIFPVLFPERKTQPVYIDDVARAIVNAAKFGHTAGNVYELGGNEVWKHEDIVRDIQAFLKLKPKLAYGQEKLVELIYNFVQRTRTPKYTPDLLKFEGLDRLTAEGSLGFADLGIPLDTLTSFEKTFPIYVRRYRKPIRFDEGIEVSYSGEVTDPRDL